VDRRGKVRRPEIRPHPLGEPQLGVCAFQSKKSESRCSPPVRMSRSTSGSNSAREIAARPE